MQFINIGIVGSRDRSSNDDFKKLLYEFNKLKTSLLVNNDVEIMIISGGAKSGADKFAEDISQKYNHHITIFRPQYLKYTGKVAPIMRNQHIVDRSEYLIALLNRDRKGGTENTVNRFIDKYKNDCKDKLILIN